MRHASDGLLRRLEDEPLAVPDRVTAHLATCTRCAGRRERIAGDTGRMARLLSGPHLVPEVDVAWAGFQRELSRPAAQRAVAGRGTGAASRRRGRLRPVSLRTGLVIGAAGLVVAGTAAAATLTTVFAPTHVAPLSLSQSDLQAVATVMGVGDSRVLGGFPTPSGSTRWAFGRIAWSSAGPARPAASLALASEQAGFPVSLPARLPAGVGAVAKIMVQPRVSATVTFASSAAGVGGSSVILDAGPAVLVEYGSASGANLPTLAVLAMPRPTAVSTGATTRQIEAFLLSRPGVPPALAEEMRLLGDVGTTLPVPVPAGASVRSVQIDGSPGVLVADASNAAAGVIWEDGGGTVHLVAGIIDTHDVLDVADQLG